MSKYMDGESSLLRVNQEQCRNLARCLARLHVRPDPYLKKPASEAECRQEANYWLYITAICQSTRTFEGTIDGQWVRGWDYLVQASRRRMEDFGAMRMQTYSAEDLLSLLSDDFCADHSPIDRVEERLEQLHDCARVLLHHYDGEAMGVYERSAGQLVGEDGLLALLSEFAAYADPLQKKSVLLAGMLHEIDVWPMGDAENLKVAMDYHAMRVALRSGMVEVQDAALARDLRNGNAVSDALNQSVRTAVSAACDIVVRESGMSVFAFDKCIWHLGRSCCFYDHAPICGPAHAAEQCFKRDRCSFIRATTYCCPNVCVLDGVCRGSRDPAYRSYWETNVYTAHY
jgi:hypothetical protein